MRRLHREYFVRRCVALSALELFVRTLDRKPSLLVIERFDFCKRLSVMAVLTGLRVEFFTELISMHVGVTLDAELRNRHIPSKNLFLVFNMALRTADLSVFASESKPSFAMIKVFAGAHDLPSTGHMAFSAFFG